MFERRKETFEAHVWAGSRRALEAFLRAHGNGLALVFVSEREPQCAYLNYREGAGWIDAPEVEIPYGYVLVFGCFGSVEVCSQERFDREFRPARGGAED